jgi:hypothetical protein
MATPREKKAYQAGKHAAQQGAPREAALCKKFMALVSEPGLDDKAPALVQAWHAGYNTAMTERPTH